MLEWYSVQDTYLSIDFILQFHLRLRLHDHNYLFIDRWVSNCRIFRLIVGFVDK